MNSLLQAKKRLEELGYENIYLWEDAPGTYYGWHTHAEDEVRMVLEGSITIGTEEKVYHLKPGDILEVPAGTRHWAKTEEGVKYLCGTRKK
ncbi:Cupin 2 conserved barrel domain protein [Hydrogenobacter thermophilus TK-6]|uniref:Cupin 2, conserved barrel domain protein n=1 Tax=Hydrogenobacter thermophilus (strain DSM 6534 / IAM 12695 / TK-6) TaxID=608538 RepID=D3DIH6_HYDTT|nr:cupin domain-containing protein [Hydrogenobacter thermophilus]ADO45554.1 Cupin 2 conserved barrel domain protein [Hydrogenobacter thermophilus TK-6]BAI69628.1 cupin 2, conserved barrel domain protein [Hydrogenobacter thermophilus TK-6]